VKKTLIATMLAAACMVSTSHAAVITLDFEGIAPHPNGNDVLLLGRADFTP